MLKQEKCVRHACIEKTKRKYFIKKKLSHNEYMSDYLTMKKLLKTPNTLIKTVYTANTFTYTSRYNCNQ